MKKTIIYGILLTAALLIPNEATDLEKMKPVEAVLVRMEDDLIIIETDTEDVGIGATVAQAMRNLEETTAGTIFLDTADYLLVTEGTEQQILEMALYLKKSVRICYAEEQIDIVDAVEFLRAHRPEIKLRQWKDGAEIEVLKEENGRLIMK